MASGGRRADLVKRLAAGRQSVQRAAAADNAFYNGNDEVEASCSTSNATASASTSPKKLKLGPAETSTSTSTSIDKTADLSDSLLERTQSHHGLDNNDNDNDTDNDTFGRADDAAGAGSSSDGGGMESPNVSPVKKARAASAPLSVGTPGRPSSPSPKVQPPTPGTAAASYALDEQRRQSLERVGSDLTDDDDDGNITNIYGGGSTYVSDLAVLGAKDANQRPSEVGYATGGKPPTTPGRRVGGSPRTPARRSSPRRSSPPKSSPNANRLLASPPKRGRRHVLSPHEVGAAAQAAAWAVAGSVDGINAHASSFPGSPHTAMTRPSPAPAVVRIPVPSPTSTMAAATIPSSTMSIPASNRPSEEETTSTSTSPASIPPSSPSSRSSRWTAASFGRRRRRTMPRKKGTHPTTRYGSTTDWTT